ncbi:RHS repeat-associated protein [Rhodococcus sp. 27YEA15]|uniref:putative T7SS-secreted protein n=1 Tax=Rhodococcus sp. 27YEA15 TaxID=3156259 RepID=UPI003C7B1F32
MGWLENVGDFVDRVGGKVEDAVESGLESAGRVIDAGTDALAGEAHRIGADGLAGALTSLGDSIASMTGGEVDELELGQTEEPKKLIRGDSSAIIGASDTLTSLSASIGSTGTALRQIDAEGWQGDGADAFNAAYDKQPQLWFDGAVAMTAAASALTSWAHAVEALQGRAADAIAVWNEATQVAKAQIAAFNAMDAEQQQANPLNDTWTAMREEARSILADARIERDGIADRIVGALQQAVAAAPAEPPFTQRMLANLTDLVDAGDLASANFRSGLVGSLSGIVAFARQINPTDTYNLTHPAQYVAGMSDIVAGVTAAAANPSAAVSMMFTGIAKNPFEFAGSVTGDAVLTAATGGAGGAVALGRNGIRIADEVAEAGAAARRLDDVPTRPAAHPESSSGSHQPEPAHDGPGAQERSNSDRGVGEESKEAGPDSDRTPDQTDCTSDPVDVATGEFLLPQTDLTLPGVLPIVLTRRHRSNYRQGRWFGRTWSSTLDMRVVVEDGGVTFVGEDGVLLTYPHPEPGVQVMPLSGQLWPLTRTDTGGYRVQDPQREISWHFAPERALSGQDLLYGNLAISAVTDRHGNRIRFIYNISGEPDEIVHSCGYRILIETVGGRIVTLVVRDEYESTVVRRFTYHEGHLSAETNGDGATTGFTYDADGRMTSWTDSNGNRMLNTYDTRGRVVRQNGTGGVLDSRFDYEDMPDGRGRVTTFTNSTGAVTVHGFDSDLRLRDVMAPSGAHTHTDFNAQRMPLRIVAPDGAITSYSYTPDGDVDRIIRPDGCAVAVDYAGPRKPVAVHTPDGASTRRSWDPDTGNLASSTDETGARTVYTYREDGAPVTAVSPLGARTEIDCNAAGLPIAVIDALGVVTRMDRDGFGRIVAVTEPDGARTEYRWSVEGKLCAQVDPDGATRQWLHDGEGNLLTYTDQIGAETRYVYGAFDLLESKHDPDGSVTTYTWDTERRLTSVANPVGGVWMYRYDPSGRLIEEVDFNGAVTTYTYDVMDRVTTITPPTGVVRKHAYDVLGQLVTVSTDAGESRTFDHDLAGRMTSAVTALQSNSIHSLTVEYSVDGLPVREVVDDQQPLTFGYDIERRMINRDSPSGSSTGWQWDLTERLRTLTADGNRIGFTHDARGQLTAWNVHELAIGRTFTDVGQLVSQSVTAHPASMLNMDVGPVTRPEPRLLRRDDYRYRDDRFLSRHTTATEVLGTIERDYEVDPAGRITDLYTGNRSEHYSYDALGNITVGGGDTARREYRGTLLVRDGRHRYSYDAAGRLIRTVTTRLSHKPDVWHYRYDGFDQLTGVTTPDGSMWEYTYDGLGRRTTKSLRDAVGSVIDQTRFVWHGTTLIEQVASRETTRWTYRPGTHTPLTQATDTEFFAIVTDLIGTPTDLVDPTSGTVAGSAVTSLWGRTSWQGVSTPLRFPGQYHDEETGLHYNLHRYYNPNTARFNTSDPLGLAPAPNPDTYVRNPTRWIDPLGLIPEACDELPNNRGLDARELSSTKTVASHVEDYGRDLYPQRPYVRSMEFTQMILDSVAPVPDLRGSPGVLSWIVEGSLGGKPGIFTLSIHMESKTIYHYLFDR